MPTNGISIPDQDKVQVPEGQKATDATWVELTNHKGDDYDDVLAVDLVYSSQS